MDKTKRLRLAGAAAGLANGLFGGGGGMILLPMLNRSGDLRPRQVFATCVAIIFPICAVSAAVSFFVGGVPLAEAVPYLVGGTAGGIVGGLTFEKVPVKWLKRIFALFLLYGAFRYLT